MRRSLAVLLSFILAVSVAAQLQESASPDEVFRSTFDRLVGEDWLFHIEIFNADGGVTFSGVDVRRFQYGIGDTFLIENVYRLEDEKHIGLQLIGLNRQARSIHLSTFFQWKPTALANVVGRFTDTGGVAGTSTAELPDGTSVQGRFACDWIEDRWTCASFVIEADGSERISDRNYYCRRSDPECGD